MNNPEWRLHARCRGLPLEIFYVSSAEKGARRIAHEEAAKRICQSCRVCQRCLSYALAIDEQHGIWGSTTPRERTALRTAVGYQS